MWHRAVWYVGTNFSKDPPHHTTLRQAQERRDLATHLRQFQTYTSEILNP